MSYVLQIIHSGKGEDATTSLIESLHEHIHNAEAAGRRHTRDCTLPKDRCLVVFHRGELTEDEDDN